MKKLYLFALLLTVASCAQQQQEQASTDAETALPPVEGNLETMLERYQPVITRAADSAAIPRSVNTDGSPHTTPTRSWTSGFLPGTLWYLYESSKDEKVLKAAREWTAFVENEKMNGGTHDLGFIVYCSFGNGYRITNDPHYRQVIIQSAKTLSTRFKPEVGAIRSWDHNADKWDYPVIIDNMMNLELLFAATRLTGDSSFYQIAVQHANTTLQNHFREDNSSFHVIDYHPETGEVENRHTHQGHAHESAWARGQAWGLYGYTMMYRETGDPAYLTQARAIADFVLDHPNMPADMVPYWDFDAPGIPDEPRDASAAAIMASALLELQAYHNSEAQEKYLNAAGKMLESLSSDVYFTAEGEFPPPFALKHSTGHKPHDSEIDVPIIYADYYYAEAMLRQKALRESDTMADY